MLNLQISKSLRIANAIKLAFVLNTHLQFILLMGPLTCLALSWVLNRCYTAAPSRIFHILKQLIARLRLEQQSLF